MTNTINGEEKQEVKEPNGIKATDPVAENGTPATLAEVNAPVSQENLNTQETDAAASELRMTFSIEVPGAQVESDFNEALLKYANDVKLPGFRKGKIPLEVVKSRFKEAISDEVIHAIIEKTIWEKIDKEKIKIAATPGVKSIDYKEGQNLKAEIILELLPKIDIPDLETLEVEIPADELKQEVYDEAKQIDAILEGHRRQTPVISREIKTGDSVRLTFQTKFLKTKRMSPRENTFVNVDETEVFDIHDLHKELIGKRVDDKLTITRQYPMDYHKKKWAGQEVEHYITIDNVFEMVKPEFNETFIKSIGFENEEMFKTQLKKEYETAMSDRVENIKIKYIIDKLNNSMDFPIPSNLVNQEISHALSHHHENLPTFQDEIQGKTFIEKMKTDAEKSIKRSFIMEAIQKKYQLEIKNDELEEKYKTIATQNQIPLKEVRKFYTNKENSPRLKDQMMREKIINLLQSKVQVKTIE